MGKQRLEAFTDGVLAIILTIMVLELRVPTGSSFSSLAAETPILLTYALSFANVGIFWNNHHHMLHATERINGVALLANLLLLFWMSLIPFVIRWMNDTHFAAAPTASYGIVLTMSAIAYTWLEWTLIQYNGPESRLAKAVGNESKGKLSLLLYILAIPLAYVHPWIAIALYCANAAAWFIPDRRIESLVG